MMTNTNAVPTFGEKQDTIDEFVSAFIEMQKALKPAHLTGRNPHFNSEYSTLEDVWEACRDALHNNGFVVMQTLMEAERPYLKTIITHSSGRSIESNCPLLLPSNDMQKLGSAISYARRYSLAALVGVVQHDDDANEAVHPQSKTSRPPTKEDGQVRFRFGKYNGKTFEEAEAFDHMLDSYIQFLKRPVGSKSIEENAKSLKMNKPLFDAYETWKLAHKALGRNPKDVDPPSYDEDIPF